MTSLLDAYLEPGLKEKFNLEFLILSLQDKMEISLAMSFHGSVADDRHFGPNLKHRKNLASGK